MKTDDLFELISRLSKGEKKIISIQAQQNKKLSSSSNIELFKIYLQLDVFCQKTISIKAKNKGIKNLAVAKVHLYQFILKSIRNTFASKRKLYEIRELIDFSDVLADKNLYKASKKQLLKAQKIACNFNFFNDQVLILRKLQDLSLLDNNTEEIEQHINKTNSEIIALTKQIFAIENYRNLLFESNYYLIKYFRNYQNLDVGKIELLKEKFSRLKKTNNINQNVLVQPELLMLESFFYFSEGDFGQAIAHQKKILALLSMKPYIIQNNPSQWLFNYKMLIAMLFFNKQYQEADNETQKFYLNFEALNFEKSNKKIKNIAYSTYYMIKLNNFLIKGEFQKGCVSVIEITTHFNEDFSSINENNRQILFYNIFSLYFGAGQFKKALSYSNKMLNYNFGLLRKDIQIFTRVMNIIIHFELGNHGLIESLTFSCKRYMKKYGVFSEFLNNFLEFSRKSFSVEYDKNAFISFRKAIDEDTIQNEFDFFDFVSWIDAKIANRTFGDVVAEKYQRELKSK